MRGKSKETSTVSTLHSSKKTAIKRTKHFKRLSILSFDNMILSPVSKRASKSNKRAKKLTKCKSELQVLEFRSERRVKRVFKIRVYQEDRVLQMPQELEDRLMQTPDDDFDCQSDEELIQEVIERKHRELAGMLVRPRNLCN